MAEAALPKQQGALSMRKTQMGDQEVEGARVKIEPPTPRHPQGQGKTLYQRGNQTRGHL